MFPSRTLWGHDWKMYGPSSPVSIGPSYWNYFCLMNYNITAAEIPTICSCLSLFCISLINRFGKMVRQESACVERLRNWHLSVSKLSTNVYPLLHLIFFSRSSRSSKTRRTLRDSRLSLEGEEVRRIYICLDRFTVRTVPASNHKSIH